jgi:hypothetical protein
VGRVLEHEAPTRRAEVSGALKYWAGDPKARFEERNEKLKQARAQ